MDKAPALPPVPWALTTKSSRLQDYAVRRSLIHVRAYAVAILKPAQAEHPPLGETMLAMCEDSADIYGSIEATLK